VPGIIRLALDTVCADLESEGYVVGPITIPACAVDAPHFRQRVWIVAHAEGNRSIWDRNITKGVRALQEWSDLDASGADVPDAATIGRNGRAHHEGQGSTERDGVEVGGDAAHTKHNPILYDEFNGECHPNIGGVGRWAVEPGICRVAHGVPHRVDRLRALGNAVVPQVVEALGRMIVAANRD
jgi:DNA (cytosine-5)-methyltransferase 1